MSAVNFYQHRKMQEKNDDVQVALEIARRKLDPEKKISVDTILSSNAKTGSKKNDLTGRSVNFSIARTCSPQKQCSGCYASDPVAHMSWNNARTQQTANTLAVNLDHVSFAANLARECASKGNLKRIWDKANQQFSLRMFGSGDLTPASVNMILELLKLTEFWYLDHGYPFVVTVFSRKERMVVSLIRQALELGLGDRLSINFSLDGSDSDDTRKRMRVIFDAGYQRYVRFVQYFNTGDVIFDNAEVRFPDHDDKANIEPDSRDCKALRYKKTGCMDCGICFRATVK